VSIVSQPRAAGFGLSFLAARSCALRAGYSSVRFVALRLDHDPFRENQEMDWKCSKCGVRHTLPDAVVEYYRRHGPASADGKPLEEVVGICDECWVKISKTLSPGYTERASHERD
jgi:hypothetical protein